ncbi:low-density lipoprotein receptor-related protein 11 isoform X2 [Sturnira hondurensis]|uniref:low-density lipoprotein receptor-related protein 11 isoform X2 n=1 Tax=Sturnira hondurensis TaxID=192404 RepID=UPI001879E556|nr:low-density lipoprotein receptor-related protein 11 isoform X2 [Sturnira hondurensis]
MAAALENHWARGWLPASRFTAHLGSLLLPPAVMAFAALESAGPKRSLRHPALRGLLLLVCLWLSSGRAAVPPPAPLSQLHAQLSGVEQLLEDFRRQLQQERPQEELELRAGHGPQQSCPSPGSGSYSVMSDAIIRIKDSIEAGASFLRAPAAVDWRQCVAACCSEPRCSVAVVEQPRRPTSLAPALGCYLFNCTASGLSVCRFAQRRGYSSYSLSRALEGQQDLEAGVLATARASPRLGKDAPPLSKAGRDVVLRLPTDEVTLDGRESTDDHAIVRYEWALLQGDPSVDMKVPESGTLKLSHLQEGTYTFQLTVTDAAAQRSSDNVSVTVLPAASSPGGCSKVCSRYHFFCDDGCCIDITLACDGVEQCADGSDEDFCHNLSLERKAMTLTATAQPRTTGQSKDAAGGFSLETVQKATPPNRPPALSDMEKRNRSTFWGPKVQTDPVVPDSGSSGKSRKEENYIFESKSNRGGAEHPAPEIGAVLPLTLGLAITVLLLLMVACRLRLVKQKLKKARPITSEESDYLINGMYL